MKRDVGMACQKRKQTRKNESDGKDTKPSPYIFSQKSKDVGIGLCIFTITLILPCLCTFWHGIPTSLFIFNGFSFLFLDFFLVMFDTQIHEAFQIFESNPSYCQQLHLHHSTAKMMSVSETTRTLR